MYHDPGAVIFAWMFTGLVFALAVVIIRNVKDLSKNHNLPNARCHHSGLD